MRPVLALLRKDLVNFFNEPIAVALTFAVPLALIYIFGQVFGGGPEAVRSSGIPLAVVNESPSPLAAKLVAALRAESNFQLVTGMPVPGGNAGAQSRPLSEAGARQMIKDNRLRFAVVLPHDAVRSDRPQLRLRFLRNPRNEIETAMVSGLVEKHVMMNAPRLLLDGFRGQAFEVLGPGKAGEFYDAMAGTIAEFFGGDKGELLKEMLGPGDPAPGGDAQASAADAPALAGDSSGQLSSFFDEMVKIESEQVVGAAVGSPGPTRNVGGWAMMFLLFSLSATAASLFEEKKAGLFLRLLAAPVRRTHILWSKYLCGTLIGLAQILVLFAAGSVMYDIDILSHLPALVVVSTAAVAACTAFGMLLAALARTQAAAQGVATFLILTMSAIGGAWFPTALMPDFLQSISRLTIVYWSVEGFLRVLWQGQGIIEVLPVVGILLGVALAINLVSAWRFRTGTMFR